VTAGNIRVALFACTYSEIDGVANTSRQFAAFAKEHGLAFLLVHAGPLDEVVTDGSVTRIQLRRCRAKFPLDGHHEFDLLFLRHYPKVMRLLREFCPDIIHITGPSDVGILGTFLAHNLAVPLSASWQTNLHQFVRRRVSSLLSRWPVNLSTKLAAAAEFASFHAVVRFYKIPRLLFTPNCELVEMLTKITGKPCSLMSHSVNTDAFCPEFRDRPAAGPFRIGYVGRLTPEKNVRFIAQLERELLARTNREFRFVLIGRGSEEKWLRENMRHAEFAGWLNGNDLSRAFANMDAFVFPSETDTFGLAVLEALSSGVPAVVSPSGGPKYTIEHGKSGYVANQFDQFAPLLVTLMSRPEIHDSMRLEARRRALSINTWQEIFAGMYQNYERYANAAAGVDSLFLEDAGKIVNT
jgi:phosphatidylinositol alpha 1,6-mannosyltransferase